MIGFKLTKKENIVFAALEEGIISIIIDRIVQDSRNCISVNFSGYNILKDNYPLWYEEKLFLGDKLLIKVEEITENSPIIIKKPGIQNHFFKHPKSIGVELTLKGEKVSAVVEEGSINLIASILNKQGETKIDLDFLSSNHSDNDKKIKYWYRNTLQQGDEFIIEVKEVEKTTLPLLGS